MNNISASLKKFMGNKNTVTILGVLVCIVILIVGYNRTINSQIKLTQVPYATQTIQPKTLITSDMVGTMSVPEAFIKVGEYYKTESQIVGKYSNYNTVIAQGSLFYKDLVTEEQYMPDSYMYNIESGYTAVLLKVDMASTYANSMMPGNYINLYFKALLPADENEDSEADSDTIIFGKFLSNVEILAVKDSKGQHVFETTEEVRTPAYMIFALKEDQHLLLRKATYLQSKYSVEILLVPNTEDLDDDTTVELSSADIEEFINKRTKMVDVSNLPSTEDLIIGGGDINLNGNVNTNTNDENNENE